MRKKRVSTALILLSAAAILFACAFFLGRATLREPFIETQRAAPAVSAVQREWIAHVKAAAASSPDTKTRVCLNTAALDELLSLPGVGEKTAERILAYREKYGKFVAVEQLLDVEGIGEGLLDKLRPYVYVEELE